VLHSNDYVRDFTLAKGTELSVTASSLILNDIVTGQGPRDAALIVGYAGWTPGQLEAEIEQNSWINVPATRELMFGTENELKWATASKSLGIDMAFFSTTVGHA
jgi:putative transcriptional regulator